MDSGTFQTLRNRLTIVNNLSAIVDRVYWIGCNFLVEMSLSGDRLYLIRSIFWVCAKLSAVSRYRNTPLDSPPTSNFAS